MNKKTIYDNLLKYLKVRNWTFIDSKTKYDIFFPPKELNFDNDFRLYISNQIDRIDFITDIEKTINTISQIYDDNTDDLHETIIDNKHILKFHLSNDNLKDDKPPLPQFENFLNKIKKILYDAASFTILQKPHILLEKDIEEAERYINLCKFVKNEKGSLVTKVELPNEEDIKLENVFESGIKGKMVNQKLFDAIEFINTKILVDEFVEPDDEFLISNKSNISLNINERVKDFYQSIDLCDIGFEFKTIGEPKVLQVKNLTMNKINNLISFTNEVKKRINEIKPLTVQGKIFLLSSKDVEGDKNSIKIKTIIDNVYKDVLLILDAEDYQIALNAHANNKTALVSGIFEKQKAYYKVIELHEFEIKNFEKKKQETSKMF